MLESINAIFDSQSYADNILARFQGAAAFIVLALGAYVFWRERASRIGIQYFIFIISVFIYLIGLSFQIAALDEKIGLFWARVSQFGVILLFATIYQFGVLFIGYEKEKRHLVIAAWILSSIFIVLNVFTELYVFEMRQYWWGGFVKFGWLPTVFLGLSSFFVMTGFTYIVQVYQQTSVDSIRHKRAKGMLWGFSFSMVAFIDTLPAYGIDIYPIGFVGLTVHAIFIATLTWRYRLVGITPEYAAKEIVDTMTDALLVLDSDRVIRLANPEAARLFSCTEKELLGQPIEEALHDPKLAKEIGRLTQGNSVKNAEVKFTNISAQPRVMNISVSVMREWNDQAVVYTCVLRDITEQRQVQSDLEHRVFERTAELAIARDQALEASRTKSSFLTNMSHELRTPLNAIIGYSEMLYEDAADITEKQAKEDLQKISSAGSHLLELINAVLDLSKIEAGKMDLHNEEFRIEGLVREVVDVLKPLVEKNSNKVETVMPENIGTMVSDRTKVKQALMNIVGNACKFTDKGTIVITVERSFSGGTEWVCFSVKDDGIGLSPQEQEKLFSEFTQASTRIPKTYGGTGLGLSISQKLCQLMGGAITVESEAGVGSDFTICLPIEVPKAENSLPEEDSAD